MVKRKVKDHREHKFLIWRVGSKHESYSQLHVKLSVNWDMAETTVNKGRGLVSNRHGSYSWLPLKAADLEKIPVAL